MEGSVRMSLADAGVALGIAPNSVRSRWKAGKLRGERDNTGKVWVWIDQIEVRSKPSTKPSIEGVLRDHIRSLSEEIGHLREERDALTIRAAEADRLSGQLEVWEARHSEVREDRDHWRAEAQRLASRPRRLWGWVRGSRSFSTGS